MVGVMIATSKASPDSMRFCRPPAVSLSTTTLLPVCFSKSGRQRQHDLLEGTGGQNLDLGRGTRRQRGQAQNHGKVGEARRYAISWAVLC